MLFRNNVPSEHKTTWLIQNGASLKKLIPPLHGGVQVKIHCSGGKSNSFWQEKTGDMIPLSL